METLLKPYGFDIPLKKKSIIFDDPPQILKEMGKKFDLAELETEREPFCIDTVNDEEKFSAYDLLTMTGHRVLDMPIKFPKSDEVRVPLELKQFDDTLGKILSFEHSINPIFVDDCFAYLTIDQKYLAAKAPHRNRHPHINSSWTHYHTSPGYVSRSYIVSDLSPKKFFKQKFSVSNLPFEIKMSRRDILCQRFSFQANHANTVEPLPYAIMAYNAFCVHMDVALPHASFRTVLRLTIDTVPYRRSMNTKNPMFQYQWD